MADRAHQPAARRRVEARRETDRRGQRVLLGPADFGDLIAGQRVGQPRLHRAQPHRLAPPGIGIGGAPGARAQHLLEDQDVAGGQIGKIPGQRGAGRAPGQAAFGVAPLVERHGVQRGVQLRLGHGLEDQRIQRAGVALDLRIRDHRIEADQPRQQPGRGGQNRGRVHVEMHPDPRIGAVMHVVIDQLGVPAHRTAPPRGAQIGLGRHRVLRLAQPVGGIGQELDQGDAQIGGAALAPVGQDLRHAVQHQPAERGVVLGQIGENRWLGRILGADLPGRAVELGRAFDLEREIHLGQHPVDPVRRRQQPWPGDQPQPIGRVIASGGRAQHDHLRGIGQGRQPGHQPRLGQRRVGRVGSRRPERGDAGDPLAALDPVGVQRQVGGGGEEPQQQRALARRIGRRLAVQHLDDVDAVDRHAARDGRQYRLAAAQVAAPIDHGPPPTVNSAVASAPPRRMR